MFYNIWSLITIGKLKVVSLNHPLSLKKQYEKSIFPNNLFLFLSHIKFTNKIQFL